MRIMLLHIPAGSMHFLKDLAHLFQFWQFCVKQGLAIFMLCQIWQFSFSKEFPHLEKVDTVGKVCL